MKFLKPTVKSSTFRSVLYSTLSILLGDDNIAHMTEILDVFVLDLASSKAANFAFQCWNWYQIQQLHYKLPDMQYSCKLYSFLSYKRKRCLILILVKLASVVCILSHN